MLSAYVISEISFSSSRSAAFQGFEIFPYRLFLSARRKFAAYAAE